MLAAAACVLQEILATWAIWAGSSPQTTRQWLGPGWPEEAIVEPVIRKRQQLASSATSLVFLGFIE